ncbi:MAG: 1,4-dihydroxy-2-naphthoate polyprenyltransferase [Myxococcales bacterium]|nr:1,4-dihydroxy-2-naphthoate polyprenyltransferase [Myxococcales bacterium]
MSPSRFQIVLLAIRPKTLGAAVAPVLIGTAMAYRDGGLHLFAAAFCLLGALLIQIGTNFANDYYDYKKGADTEERLGPVRVTQAGFVKPETMKRAYIAVFAAAILAGVPLIMRGGWPILVLGLVSVGAGVLYTYGPFALAYTGLGDIFVVIFFGPVAVGGTYYLQTLHLSKLPLLAGLGPGLIATGLLAVNNLRDIDGDSKVNKRTLAVRFGVTFARIEYLLCLLIPALLPVALAFYTRAHFYSIAAALILVIGFPALRLVWTSRDGHKLNEALGTTGKLLLIYSLLFSLGWALS